MRFTSPAPIWETRGLETECKARNRIGIPGRILDKPTLREAFDIDRTGAIISSKSAIANPVQLAAGLLRRAVEHGAKIFHPLMSATSFAGSHGVILDTGKHFIVAKSVVFCTGRGAQRPPEEGHKDHIQLGYRVTSESPLPELARPYTRMGSLDALSILANNSIRAPGGRRRRRRSGSALLSGPQHRAQKRSDRKQDRGANPGLTFEPTYKWTAAFGKAQTDCR